MSLAASVGIAGSTALLGVPARAGVWNLTAELSASGEYSTNPQLLLTGPQSGSAAVANIGVPVGWYDDADQVELAARARLAEASGSSPIGHNGYYFAATTRTDFERGSLNLAGHWADDSAAVVAAPASGTLTRLNIGERGLDGSMSSTFAVTARLQNNFGAAWQDQHYSFLPGSGLYDYDYSSVSEGLQESITARTQLQAVTSVSRYRAPDLGYTENGVSVQVGFGQSLSERWTYSLLYGRSRAESPGIATRSYGTVYATTIARKSERSSVSASLTQSFQPSGFGALTLTREATLRGDFNKTERLSGFVALRSVQTSATLSALAFTDRRYQAASGGLNWAASEYWDVSLTVDYQRQAIDFNSQSGQGTGARLSATRRFGHRKLN